MDTTYPVRPYRADGGFEPSGLVLMTVALLLAATALGTAASYISEYFYFVFVFPAGFGAILGTLGTAMIDRGKIRSPLVAGAVGLIAGFTAMLMFHYVDHERMRAKLDVDVEAVRAEYEDLQKIEPSERTAEMNEAAANLRRTLIIADGTLPEFMDLRAEEGVQLGRSDRGGVNLGYIGSWIYWGIEVLIVAGIAFVLMRARADEPYSEQANAWKTVEVVGGFGADRATIKRAVLSGEMRQLEALEPGPFAGGASGAARVMLATAPDFPESDDVDLKVDWVRYDAKGNERASTVVHATYPGDALPELRQLFAHAMPPRGATAQDDAEV